MDMRSCPLMTQSGHQVFYKKLLFGVGFGVFLFASNSFFDAGFFSSLLAFLSCGAVVVIEEPFIAVLKLEPARERFLL